MFDLRQEGDYIDFVSLDAEVVEPLVDATAEFIDTIRHCKLSYKKQTNHAFTRSAFGSGMRRDFCSFFSGKMV